MQYKFLLIPLLVFNHIMLNANFKKQMVPQETWSTIGSIGAVGLVGACSSYLLYKSKQFHEKKFEDVRYQLQVRGIIIREEKNLSADIVRAYGKIRHPETENYLKQLSASHQAKHTREQLLQSALVITLTTGLSALLMSKNRLMH